VSAGVGLNAADAKSVPVNEDETPTTAAEMRALAEEAEAEAAEAEALAVAARARARAMQLRRQAERADAAAQVEAAKAVTTEVAGDEEVSEEAEAATAIGVPDTQSETEPEDAEAEVEDVEAEDFLDVAIADEAEDADEAEEFEEVDEADATEEVDEVEDADADLSSEDDDEDEDEEEFADEVAEKRPLRLRRLRRRPKWSTIAAALAILIIIGAVSGSVYMVLAHRNATRQQHRVAEFDAAARQGVVTLTSLDFNDAKEGVRRIVDDSTGSFKDDFLKMADDFVKVVEQSKVVARGTVQAAAVELDTMTADSAVVLVACTSEITNAAGAKQDPRSYRLIVTMTRDGGQLKMSKVEFVP
jgi:Mce-associated membrane protein